MIGLAVPEVRLPYFAELADSVMRAAEDAGLTVLAEQTGAVRERELEVLSGRRRHITDGLIFSPLELGEGDRALFEVDFPMVLLGERIFSGPADHVTMNDVDGAYAATRHLIDLGRRRIALLGNHPGETLGSAALRERGYVNALRDAGIAFDPGLLGEARLWHRSTGADAMVRLLDSGVEIDGVFGMNDAMALGALHVLHDRRIDVPDQIAVIGFDDTDESRYSSPPLTSVVPGREQMAQTAVKLLVEQLASGGADRPRVEVVADYSIAVRGSTVPGAR
jgi:DNA-binding LacI/PurR family transcriptional regulator